MTGKPPTRERAELEGDFVVFLIGMRINRPWRIDKWLPVLRAMPPMVRELEARPELGLLGAETFFGRTTCMIQYWRSPELLFDYARSKDRAHLPAWGAFNRRAQGTGAVGIFHETYVVAAGRYENVYVDMPAFGLGRAGARGPAAGPRRIQGADDRERSTPWAGMSRRSSSRRTSRAAR